MDLQVHYKDSVNKELISMIITKCQTVSWLEVIEGLEGVRGNVMIQFLQMAFQFFAIRFCVCFDMFPSHNSDKYGKESIQFYRSYKSYFNWLEYNKNI